MARRRLRQHQAFALSEVGPGGIAASAQDVRKIQVKVKPGARISRIEAQEDGSWIAWVKAQPVDGKANAELTALIARQFGLPKARVVIKAGAGGRTKLVEIAE